MAAKIDTGTSFNSGPGSLIGSDLDKIEFTNLQLSSDITIGPDGINQLPIMKRSF